MKKAAKKKSSAKPTESSSKREASKNEGGEIIEFIKRDHKPLKELISVMKDPKAKMAEKKPVFKKFQSLLLRHAHAEEQSLYIELKSRKDLRLDGVEGDVEHALADGLMEEIDSIQNDNDTWMAKVKVLAEVVEHHIEEEEDDMLKKVRKEFDLQMRTEIGEEYERLYDELRRSEVELPTKQSASPDSHRAESLRDL